MTADDVLTAAVRVCSYVQHVSIVASSVTRQELTLTHEGPSKAECHIPFHHLLSASDADLLEYYIMPCIGRAHVATAE